MNILKFLDALASDNLAKGIGSRRESFTQFKKFGSDMAMASVPFGLAGIALNSNSASAQDIGPTPNTPVGALSLALTLEYLEAKFYNMGLASGVIPTGGRDEKVFMQIAAHENDHVAYLVAGLAAAGAPAVQEPVFDFTGGQGLGGGPFDPFNTTGIGNVLAYQQFLALAQAFEDTGVRAYKGQAGNLISTPDLLTAALQIHSVEARHASEVRRLRGQKGWIVGNDRGGLPVQAQAVYDGEQNLDQAGYNTAAEFGANAGSESFDEPIDTATAVAIANLFIV